MRNSIKTAYQKSLAIYDDVLTQDKWWSKLYIKIFWQGVNDWAIAKKVLAYIPQDFNGKLLDVPVGTGVFTVSTYKRLPHAEIHCVDYSEDMLDQAITRFHREDLNNVKCHQGDVGNLSFYDASFDIVLSMNGFHAFPNKEKAYSEIYRVLKTGGKFIGCFYIKEASKVTDALVKFILAKKGWFTPPFESFQSLKYRLETSYREVAIHRDGAMVYFCCLK